MGVQILSCLAIWILVIEMNRRSIVVNGDLGSGKSTVSREIARRLGLRYVSMGDLYREIAQKRGMSALELNLHAERDEGVDNYVDQLQREIAASGEQLVVDSRLAWFFFTNAFKVHLVTDPPVAAARVLSRPGDGVESYTSAGEAEESLRSRSESERTRFLRKYGVDKARLRNYDLICDTTKASPEDMAEHILAAYEGSLGAGILADRPPLLLLDPARVYPTEPVKPLPSPHEPELAGVAGLDGPDPLVFGYCAPDFYLLAGHQRLSAAIAGGAALVAGWLQAEDSEEVADGLTAAQCFGTRVSLETLCDWNDAHKTRLRLPPHLAQVSCG